MFRALALIIRRSKLHYTPIGVMIPETVQCNSDLPMISTCAPMISTCVPMISTYVSNIPVKHEVKELQKTAILGTVHILRKVLM